MAKAPARMGAGSWEQGLGNVSRDRGPVLRVRGGLGAQHGALSMEKPLLESFLKSSPQATNRDNLHTKLKCSYTGPLPSQSNSDLY